MSNALRKDNLKRLVSNPRIWIGFGIVFFIVVAALCAPWLAPFDPEEMDITQRILPPNSVHLLGCDLNGRDVLTAMLYGARTSLYIAF